MEILNEQYTEDTPWGGQVERYDDDEDRFKEIKNKENKEKKEQYQKMWREHDEYQLKNN